MKVKKNNNVLKISIIYFVLLVIVAFIILLFQLNYCKNNNIDIMTLISETTGIYNACIEAILAVFGGGSLVLLLGVFFGNFIYAFIIGFVIIASIVLIVFICKMLLGGFAMRF